MGAAKLAIKTKYQPGRQENDHNEDGPDQQALSDLFPYESSPDPVSRCVRDLVYFKTIVEFPFLFFHLYIAELVIDKK
jgi:hypothetical protein